MGGRIERRQLIAERQFVAVLLDEGGDLFGAASLQRNREARKRSGDRQAGREGLLVVVDLHGFFPAGHHGHVVVVFAGNRALVPQRLEEWVRIVDQSFIAEKIDTGWVDRHLCSRSSRTYENAALIYE
ncbi:hypothetical protein J2S38_002426 [Mycolicibacterium senegalense]|nr:hypothetical protein [Mycolicibacterium senegalense]